MQEWCCARIPTCIPGTLRCVMYSYTLCADCADRRCAATTNQLIHRTHPTTHLTARSLECQGSNKSTNQQAMCTRLSFVTYSPTHAKGSSVGGRLVVRVLLLHCHVCLGRISIARLQLYACNEQSAENTRQKHTHSRARIAHITIAHVTRTKPEQLCSGPVLRTCSLTTPAPAPPSGHCAPAPTCHPQSPSDSRSCRPIQSCCRPWLLHAAHLSAVVPWPALFELPHMPVREPGLRPNSHVTGLTFGLATHRTGRNVAHCPKAPMSETEKVIG